MVGAPEADEDHPEETSYVPFEIAGLMSDVSITYNHVVARMIHPEQNDLSYLFEGMERPLARPSAQPPAIVASPRPGPSAAPPFATPMPSCSRRRHASLSSLPR